VPLNRGRHETTSFTGSGQDRTVCTQNALFVVDGAAKVPFGSEPDKSASPLLERLYAIDCVASEGKILMRSLIMLLIGIPLLIIIILWLILGHAIERAVRASSNQKVIIPG
jgi:protein-S-isoprenylcysteine O-methyltransferase Ste14